MSQKSSLPQVTRFVSRPLMPDTCASILESIWTGPIQS